MQTHLKPMDTITEKNNAILLSDKSAKLICARQKKEIILNKNNTRYVGKPIFLCGDKVMFCSFPFSLPYKGNFPWR